MRSFLQAVLGYFLTPAALIAVGALDSSLVFFLPLGIDFVVIILAARTPELFWLYALLATIGTVLGSAVTFWIGRKIGERGLSLLTHPARLERIERRIRGGAAISAGLLAIIPPPFPFTAFVLAGGAFGVNPVWFLIAMTGARLVRFTAEAALAAHYGAGILRWMESTTFEIAVGVLIVLAVAGTIVSAVAVARGTRRHRRNRSSAATPP